MANIKLVTNNWETSGVYDLTQGKTQRQINADLIQADSDLNGAITSIENGIAIVANGNTHAAIASGQYVYIKGHSTLAEGLYKAKSAISVNATLSSTNVASVPNGFANTFVPEGVTLSHVTNSYTTEVNSSCYKVGNLCIIGIVIDLKANFPASTSDTVIMNNAPKSAVFYGVQALRNASGGINILSVGKQANGNITISSGMAAPTGLYRTQIVYPWID